MPTDILIGLLVIGALVLWVLVLGPLYVVWCWYRMHVTAKHFRTMCQVVGASGDPDDMFQTKALGDHRIHLVRLSEGMRESFEEAPLLMPPWWLKNRTSEGYWPKDRCAQFLEEFPYQPININNGPILLLLSSCTLPHPFVITAGKNRRARNDDKDWSYGDPDFDRLICVRCDNHSFMTDYLTATRRTAIMRLFELGFTHAMYVKRARSLLIVSNARFLLWNANANAGLQVLDLFTKILPESPGLTPKELEMITTSQATRRQRRLSEHTDKVFMAPLIVLFATYLFGHHAAVHMVSSDGFIALQVVVAGLLLLSIALLLGNFIRRLSISFILALILLPLGSGHGIALLNRSMDRSAPQEILATVGEVSTHYFLRTNLTKPHLSFLETHYAVQLSFRDHRDQTRYTSLEIPKDVVDRVYAAKGLQCRIFVRAGALGFQHLTGRIVLSNTGG